MPYLIYHDQNGKETIQIREMCEFYIGRTKDNDITILDDPSVSRKHCMLYANSEEKKFILRDLNSSNGTFLNERALSSEEARLEDGDKVIVGNAEFIFCTENPERYQTTSTTIIKSFGSNKKQKGKNAGKYEKQDTLKLNRFSVEEEILGASRPIEKELNPAALPAGIDVNGYKIIRSLGTGRYNYATVYLAYQASVRRTVAVKIFTVPQSPEAASSFVSHIRKFGNLNHPNIIPDFDGGIFLDSCYLVMAYMPEGSLRDKISRSGSLSEKEAFLIARKIAESLNYACLEHGLSHFNVNSRNILFSDSNEPSIGGVGLWGWIVRYIQTGRTSFFGDPLYMSPEQASDKNADWRSDLYSLGITLFEMITGRLPFTSENPHELIEMHRSQKIVFPSGMSKEAQNIISGMTAKNVYERFQSWSAFIKAVSVSLETKQISNVQRKTPLKFTSQPKKLILKNKPSS